MLHGFFDWEGSYFSDHMSINGTRKPSLLFFPNVDELILSCPSILSVFMIYVKKLEAPLGWKQERAGQLQCGEGYTLQQVACSSNGSIKVSFRLIRNKLCVLTTQYSHLPFPYWGRLPQLQRMRKVGFEHNEWMKLIVNCFVFRLLGVTGWHSKPLSWKNYFLGWMDFHLFIYFSSISWIVSN